VTSFDYDLDSVSATASLRQRYGEPPHWEVFQGSILDEALVERYRADVVYSWGVLHHTGQMWQAIRNAASMVNPGGLFCIAIYNRIDRWRGGGSSATWVKLKRLYVNSPAWRQRLIVLGYKAWFFAYHGLVLRQNPFRLIQNYRSNRGMNWHTDVVDWVGGYPFEYASPDEITTFCEQRLGLETVNVHIVGGHGCNEFVFMHSAS
jgi:2-polyprenyl-6-hydroxyphenyl methylase/3-demethylubiquinone-9 3-methyltransferase